jgi:hypothetical protein
MLSNEFKQAKHEFLRFNIILESTKQLDPKIIDAEKYLESLNTTTKN